MKKQKMKNFREFLEEEYSDQEIEDTQLEGVQANLHAIMKDKNEGAQVYSSALSVRYK